MSHVFGQFSLIEKYKKLLNAKHLVSLQILQNKRTRFGHQIALWIKDFQWKQVDALDKRWTNDIWLSKVLFRNKEMEQKRIHWREQIECFELIWHQVVRTIKKMQKKGTGNIDWVFYILSISCRDVLF